MCEIFKGWTASFGIGFNGIQQKLQLFFDQPRPG